MAAHGEPGVRTILDMPSALYDAHPLWRTPRIRTVIDIEVVSQHAERCRRDDGTARRSTASVAGTGADDDPSSRRRPSHSSSRSNAGANPRRGRALGYRATRTPADGRALRLVSCCSKSDPARRGAHGLVMRRRAAHLLPPVPPRCRVRAGRATRSGSVRAGRWPAGGACA